MIASTPDSGPLQVEKFCPPASPAALAPCPTAHTLAARPPWQPPRQFQLEDNCTSCCLAPASCPFSKSGLDRSRQPFCKFLCCLRKPNNEKENRELRPVLSQNFYKDLPTLQLEKSISPPFPGRALETSADHLLVTQPQATRARSLLTLSWPLLPAFMSPHSVLFSSSSFAGPSLTVCPVNVTSPQAPKLPLPPFTPHTLTSASFTLTVWTPTSTPPLCGNCHPQVRGHLNPAHLQGVAPIPAHSPFSSCLPRPPHTPTP